MPKLPTRYKVEYINGFGKCSVVYDLKEGGELLDLKTAKSRAELEVKKGALEARILKIDGKNEQLVMVCMQHNGKTISWKTLEKS